MRRFTSRRPSQPASSGLNTWVGKRNSLHCTAVGKALLLQHDRDELRVLFQTAGLPRRTDRTITDLSLFADDLLASARRGYAVDDAEDELEGRCVAAPSTAIPARSSLRSGSREPRTRSIPSGARPSASSSATTPGRSPPASVTSRKGPHPGAELRRTGVRSRVQQDPIDRSATPG